MKRLIIICAIITLTIQSMLATDIKINVTVNSKTFAATISDTETGRAFYDLLPMTLNMTELNGNEKYHYLDTSLPVSTFRPGTINAGDILLYGASCVVIFYETFSSSYSYTRIGTIDNPTGLAQALGTGNPTVKFEKASATITGITEAQTDENAPQEIFDTHGRRVASTDTANLPHGLYIIKKGQQIKKIIK